MNNHFNVTGDQMPNLDRTHLEAQEKSEIWKFYTVHITNALLEDDESILCYSKFIQLWATGYFHVKIRDFKAVEGKCNSCAMLNEARNKFENYFIRQQITDFHALHRITYMSEKKLIMQKF